MKDLGLFFLFISFCFYKKYLCVDIKMDSSIMKSGLFYSIPREHFGKTLEIIAAGATGGGNVNGAGGRGGYVALLYKPEPTDRFVYSVGENGGSISTTCLTAGGGGATSVYLYGPPNTAQVGKPILIAQGGGGGGLGQNAIDPDYNDINEATSAPCLTTDSELAAQPGRDIKNVYNYSILTFNPTKPNVNYSAGCLGGYGGGGQGGFVTDMKNLSAPAGGGGGGGGYEGGKTKIESSSCIWTAGGPGKSMCTHFKCSVPKRNPDLNGYFKIKIHDPYRRLFPIRDRTNYERPPVDTRIRLIGHTLKVSSSILMIILICTLLHMEFTG